MRVYPLPKGWRINTQFGAGGHNGVDLDHNDGSPVYAAAAGTVYDVQNLTTSYGSHVKIRHPGGLISIYAHMIRGSIRVSVGDRVEPGTPLGRMGTTGNSTGTHLHFEVQNAAGGQVNPLQWVAAGGGATVGNGVKVGKVVPGSADTGGGKVFPLPKPQSRPKGSGLSVPYFGAGSFTLRGKKMEAGVTALVDSVALDAGSEQVAQLSLVSHDPGLAMSRSHLASASTSLLWTLGKRTSEWDVSAVRVAAASNQVTVDARSRLARNLRRRYNVRSAHKVSPDEWVTRTVVGAGGRVVAEKAPRRGEISQGSDQSEWDVIAGLANDLGWSWCEFGGTLYFGSKRWAWQGGPDLPHWPVTWLKNQKTDAIDLTLSKTPDDREMSASGTLTLPWNRGSLLAPWHTVEVSGMGVWDGVYLVDSLSVSTDGTTPVVVDLIVPRKPAKAPKESSSTGTRIGTPPTRDKKSVAYAKWYARQTMRRAPFGWKSDEAWKALEKLWTRESGWRWNADNPTSSAYGIPQSLPGSKMASAGSDWRTNPETQIRWGLGYIKGRYGGPISAWAHSQSKGWY